ncbi:MAG: hypothetical protein IIA44_00635 [Acidobacteria bacterium]|nr:hypothetical protein [Acidobacteriota bacterium]
MSVQADQTRRGVLRRLQIRHLYPLIVLALYPLAAIGPMRDNSFLWHVRAGQAQWDQGQVLSIDVFSYSMADAAWRTQSWLAELSYSGLEAITGTVGWAPALVALVGGLAIALIGIAVFGATRSTFTTALWMFIAVWLAAPFANPRPVIFSYVLLAALVLVLRLEKELADNHIEELNDTFGDLVAKRKISKTGPLRVESDEPHLRSKPRIAFSYNQTSAGRLTQMILTINQMARTLADVA